MEKKVGPFEIASAYIGVTIGAGFASGQEVLQFFTLFGLNSLPAILLSSVLFVFFGAIVLNLGRRLRAASHLEIIRYAGGKYLSVITDVITTLFLFGITSAMAAGAGAIFAQQFNLPALWGAAAMMGLTLATVLLGIRALISALGFVVPLLLVGVLGVTSVTLAANPVDLDAVSLVARPWNAVVPFWPLSALTYVSYNLIVAVAILAPMGALARRGRVAYEGALVGGIGLGVGILAINLAMLAVPESTTVPVPMAFIAGRISGYIQFLYAFVLMLAIYTTAVGALYGFAARFAVSTSPRFRWIALATGVSGLIGAEFGFTILVRYLYSAIGVAGFILLGGLTYSYIRESLPRRLANR